MSKPKNYAKYRSELKELCPRMGEKEIYLHWRTTLDPDNFWQVIQEPVRGYNGKYHFVYVTIVPSGEIYVGRHSTLDLDDGYHGSGVRVQELESQGVELVTIPLEFFRSYEMSLVAEAEIVDRDFLIEPGVLNQTPGGDDSRHGDDTRHDSESESPYVVKPPKYNSGLLPSNKSQSTILCETVSVDMPFGEEVEVPVVKSPATKVVEKPRSTVKSRSESFTPAKDSPNFASFEELGVSVGGKLEYVPDPSIFAEVVDSDRKVKCKGKTTTLTTTTLNLLGMKYRKGFQPLNYWRWNGKLLIEIREGLLKKKR